MKTIYGPVASWRFRRSLGVDPLCSKEKICSFDCIYCQLGKAKSKTLERREYVSYERVCQELDATDKKNVDVITFAGTGEPTLNSRLGDMIQYAKKFRLPVVVITNSSLLHLPEVRSDLMAADIVSAKLDAPNEELLQKINQPIAGLNLYTMIDGIQKFKSEFKNKLTLQIMFVEENLSFAKEIAELARKIAPAAIEINTPTRRSLIKPLTPKLIRQAAAFFTDMPCVSVYDKPKFKVVPIDLQETLLRQPEDAK